MNETSAVALDPDRAYELVNGEQCPVADLFRTPGRR
jgi:hypothetical protein